MSDLLGKWLTQDLGLQPLHSFESDFQDGFLLGDVLVRVGALPEDSFAEQFDGSHSSASIVNNFKAAGSALKLLGIRLDATAANQIMSGHPGAALRLLYQIKMASSRRQKAKSSTPKGQSVTFGTSISRGRSTLRSSIGGAQGSGSAAEPPVTGFRKPHEQLDMMETRQFDKRFTSSVYNSKVHENMEWHLRQFTEAKVRLEQKAMEDSLRDELALHQKWNQRRQREAAERHTRHQQQRELQEADRHAWSSNMSRARARKQADLRYELTAAQRSEVRKQQERSAELRETNALLDAFEANLERVASASAGPSRGDAEEMHQNEDDSGRPETPVGFVSTLRKKLPAEVQSTAAANATLKRIQTKLKGERAARTDRERRRRKVLVEHQAQMEAAEEEERNRMLILRLQQESAVERRLAAEVWRAGQEQQIMLENMRYRTRQEAIRREQDYVEERERDNQLYEAERKRNKADIEAKKQRAKENAAEMIEEQHRENEAYARHLALRVVEMSLKAAHYRALDAETQLAAEHAFEQGIGPEPPARATPVGLIPERVWHNWLEQFHSSAASIVELDAFRARATAETQEEKGNAGSVVADILASVERDMAIVCAESSETSERWNSQMLEEYLSVSPAGTPHGSAGRPRSPPRVGGLWGFPSSPVGVSQDAKTQDPNIYSDTPVVAVDKRVIPRDEVLGALLLRACNLAAGLYEWPKLPLIPPSPIGVLVLGRPFSGRHTQARLLAEHHGLRLLDAQQLVEDALKALEDVKALDSKGAKIKLRVSEKKLTKQQAVAYAMAQGMAKGEAVTDEQMVSLITLAVEEVRAEHNRVDAAVDDTTESKGKRKGSAKGPKKDADTPATESNQSRTPGGWVLVGFPSTEAQARLLDKALSGFEPPLEHTPATSMVSPPPEAALDMPPEQPYKGASAFQLAVELRVPEEEALARAMGRRIDPETGIMYHLQSRNDSAAPLPLPPMDPVVRGRLAPAPDSEQLSAALPEMMSNWNAEELSLMKWYRQFDVLRVVDGGLPIPGVSARLTAYVEDIIAQEEHAKAQKAAMEEAAAAQATQDAEDTKAALEQERVIAAAEVQRARAQAEEEAKLDPKERKAREKEKADQAKEPPSNAVAAGVQPEDEIDQPSADLSFKNFKDEALAKLIASRWLQTEEAYVGALNRAFEVLRQMHHHELQHWAVQRKSFWWFLREGMQVAQPAASTDKAVKGGKKVEPTPEPTSSDSLSDAAKQRLIDHFVTEFNSMSQDFRSDPDAQSELHLRVDSLSEALWSIVEQRRDIAETRLHAIVADNWFKNHSDALCRVLHALIQAEEQRYKSSILIAADFFAATSGVTQTPTDEAVDAAAQWQAASAVAAWDDADTDGKKGKAGDKKTDKRGSVATKGSKGKPDSRAGSSQRVATDSVITDDEIALLESEQQELLSHLQRVVDGVLTTLLVEEIVTLAASGDEATKGKDKTGKDKAKKGKSDVAEPLSVVVGSEQAQKLCQNVISAENGIVKFRLQRLLSVAERLLTTLRGKVEREVSVLDRVLGLRVKGESDSIESLSLTLKTLIESGQPVYHQMRLAGEHAFVDQHLLQLEYPRLIAGVEANSQEHGASHLAGPAVVCTLLAEFRRFAFTLSEGPDSNAYEHKGHKSHASSMLRVGDCAELLLRLASSSADTPLDEKSSSVEQLIAWGRDRLNGGALRGNALAPAWSSLSLDDFVDVLSPFDVNGDGLIDYRAVLVPLLIDQDRPTPTSEQLAALLSTLQSHTNDVGVVSEENFLSSDVQSRLCDLTAGDLEVTARLLFNILATPTAAGWTVSPSLVVRVLCFDSAASTDSNGQATAASLGVADAVHNSYGYSRQDLRQSLLRVLQRKQEPVSSL